MAIKIKENLIDILKSDFIKNIATLISGNIIGYGINLITLPIISRVYTQSELGGYDLIVSSAGIFLTILQLSLMLVIMIPKEDYQAAVISRIIWYFTLIGSFLSVVFLIVLSFMPSGFQLFEVNISYPYGLLLFGCYLVFYNLQNIYYAFSNRKKLYSVLFWNPILMAAANGILSIGFGLCGKGIAGYLFGTIASYAIAILHMKRYVQPFLGKFNFEEIKKTLFVYRAYPLVQLPAALVASIAIQIPAQFLGRMFSTAVLGGYTMACKILSVPVALLASPVNRVYYRSLVEKLEKQENAGEFAFSLLKHNILLAVVPVGILMIFGDWIAGFVLGKGWEISGIYILIMGMMYLLKYCSTCMSGTFVAVGMQKLSFKFSLFTLLLFSVWGGITYWADLSAMEAIILYTIFASAQELLNLLLCMYCLKFSIWHYIKFVLTYILGSVVGIYLLYGLRKWIEWRIFK